MLLVGDRVVLRTAAPPETEFALFEIGDIELRSSEPGRVREHGYQTTVASARDRLVQLGATPALARECALAMHPELSAAYARGIAVKHVARYLGPSELFQSDGFDAAKHAYHGVFLDLPALANDLDLPGAGLALQALYLATLLEGEVDETTVFLSTDAWTKIRKPGERTHRRPNLGALSSLHAKLRALKGRDPRPNITEQLARADVIAFVRTRADAAPDDDARDLYAGLEKAIAVRDIPDRGPLADRELWDVEVKLDAGIYEGVLDTVDSIERQRGRTPGTTYLRARASLALRLEPAKLVAERVSALALSMTSFQELCLLAAEAWLEAGDARRAMPYARDLVDAPGIEEGLLLRAQRLLARAVGAAPAHKTYADSIPAAPMPPSSKHPAAPPSQNPPVSAPEPHVARSYPPERSRIPTQRGAIPDPRAEAGAARVTSSFPPAGAAPSTSVVPPTRATSVIPPPPPSPFDDADSTPKPAPPVRGVLPATRAANAPPPPISAIPPAKAPKPSRRPVEAVVVPKAPPPLDLELTPQPQRAPASFTLDLPGPDTVAKNAAAANRAASAPPKASAPPSKAPVPQPSTPPRKAASTPPPSETSKKARNPRDDEPTKKPGRAERMGGHVKMETRAPPAFDPRAEPESDREMSENAGPETRPSTRPTPMRTPSSKPPFRAPMPTPVLDADLPPQSTEAMARTIDREKGIQRQSSDPGISVELHGASLPPFRLEQPPPLLPKAPLLPKLGGTSDELVEHLALPPGLGHETRRTDALPRSVLEARVMFTQLARELGLDYRLKRGIELRADVSGIEAMQAVLLESFPDHGIRSNDDALELRRHGALVSEILARRLEAEWIDISPNELGYWAMIVPPDTRVWPFGRVARLIEMGHKERDLVSYFLELSSRARPR